MAFEEFLKLKGFKKKTIDAHLRKIKKLKKFSFNYIKEEIIKTLNTKTKATANKYLTTYRTYAKYLVDIKKKRPSEINWIYQFKYYKETPKQKVIFSAYEMDKFLQYFDRYSTYFTVLARTGARPMEIASLKKTDIDYSNNLILIQESKTGEGRSVPIPDDIISNFYSYLRQHKSKWCFPIKNRLENHITIESLRKAFKIRRENLGLNPELTPYCLRHTFITRMLGAGVPLFVVQSIVGHKKANTTQMYFHLNTQMMREGMKKDPVIWSNLPHQEKLKIVDEYINKLGLDTDPSFNYCRSSNKVSLSLKS